MAQATSAATRAATRAYRTEVVRVQRLSEHFLRITVTGEDLVHFGPQQTAGQQVETLPAWDQRIKLFLPRADGSYPELGLFADPPASIMQWYTAWRQLDDTDRNPIRTYTVRAIRPQVPEVDIDFVIHTEADGSTGPAAGWAVEAAPGDELIVIGPDRRAEVPGGGIDFTPGSARHLLLAGDETAVPALCAILEALPADYTGHAYLEVPTADDVLGVETGSGVLVHWLPRDGAELGTRLTTAVQHWAQTRQQQSSQQPARDRESGQQLPEVDAEGILWETATPEGYGEYAWLAGEAGVITGLRRYLVKEVGLSREQVSFMGYWRQGRPGA
ncbi:siderophore-interacting protein [Nesterenkonia alba]|uniref:siderophore-interacting protein n=1 Tax=Nesterenkonia alba TaxID=515814 RepID=UPI0003B37C21|nr:siderophore-interacting protein [Nesterenkonia alba]